MKRSVLLSLIISCMAFTSLKAQNKDNFSLRGIALYGLAWGVAQNSNQPDYNYTSRSIDGLLNFDFGKLIGVSTGFGVSSLTGNGFDSSGDFFHTRTLFKIPLLMTIIYPITDNFEVYANGGFFYEQILDDEFQYLGTTINDVYDGSNIGAQAQLGLVLLPPKKLNGLWESFRIGLVVSAQVSGDYESNGNFTNTQDLGDLFGISAFASYTF